MKYLQEINEAYEPTANYSKVIHTTGAIVETSGIYLRDTRLVSNAPEMLSKPESDTILEIMRKNNITQLLVFNPVLSLNK